MNEALFLDVFGIESLHVLEVLRTIEITRVMRKYAKSCGNGSRLLVDSTEQIPDTWYKLVLIKVACRCTLSFI